MNSLIICTRCPNYLCSRSNYYCSVLSVLSRSEMPILCIGRYFQIPFPQNNAKRLLYQEVGSYMVLAFRAARMYVWTVMNLLLTYSRSRRSSKWRSSLKRDGTRHESGMSLRKHKAATRSKELLAIKLLTICHACTLSAVKGTPFLQISEFFADVYRHHAKRKPYRITFFGSKWALVLLPKCLK